jgi:hypothetical protein
LLLAAQQLQSKLGWNAAAAADTLNNLSLQAAVVLTLTPLFAAVQLTSPAAVQQMIQ